MSIDQGRPRHALGVDFGTSNTVAVAQWPDGRARPLLIDGSPLLPSAVFAESDGPLAVGRDAVYSARIDPSRFEPNPKRRIDEDRVLLGDREVRTVELISAVLSRVAEEWRNAAGPVQPEVTLTCPASWGATRRTLLAEAATMAGLADPRLVAEPVAAATYFAGVLGRDVPIGSVVVVHDFGAGTFDASVVARTAEGFEVLAVDGRDDIGGLDIDAALIEHLAAGDDGWRPLLMPETLAERRAQRQLWDDVRIAKERLSRAQSADLVVPLLNHEVHITRDELEKLARPLLEQTVQVTQNLIEWARLPEGRLAGVFLVGGASRIPLVATLLHRALGEAPVAIEQPELVVAEGSLLADAALLAGDPAAPGPTAEMPRFGFRPPTAASPSPAPLPPSSPAPSSPSPSGEVVPETVDYSEYDFGSSSEEPSRELRPAVDPWADAAPVHWTPDPGATVVREPFATTPPPSSGPPQGSSSFPATGSASLPGSNRPSSGAGPASRPGSGAGSRSGSGSVFAPGSASLPRPTPSAGPAPQPFATRPMPPSADPQRRASGRSRPSAGGQAQRPSAQRPSAQRPQARRPRPRRRGRFLRGVQILISILLLIAAPLLAMVLAYGYGNGEPFIDDVEQVLSDIARFVGLA